jgi:tRNA(adenine34) deaminase
MTHKEYMKLAIGEAEKAGQKDEVPIGAVLVAENGEVLSSSYNSTVSLSDPSAHAEILAMREAGRKINNYRLLNTILYVTVEPCIMCMGAIIHARIKKIIFGVHDPKGGAAGSLYNFADDKRLNHRVEIIPGICEDECRSLIKYFFLKKRRR